MRDRIYYAPSPEDLEVMRYLARVWIIHNPAQRTITDMDGKPITDMSYDRFCEFILIREQVLERAGIIRTVQLDKEAYRIELTNEGVNYLF